MNKNMIKSVLSLPTMSFHEDAVATFVRFYSLGLGLKVVEDKARNLLVEYKGSNVSGTTFAAHMDHPGFEVISSKGLTSVVALWGKVDPKFFAGSKVIVYTDDGAINGKIDKKVLKQKHMGRFCFNLKTNSKVSVNDFGHYDLPAIRFEGDRIITRAADNLISVSILLDLLTQLVNTKSKVNVSCLFTRAEEAGFLGAFAAIESGLASKKNPLVVLECSSANGGKVDIGGGPVVRAGDLQSTYDPAVDIWLSGVAVNLAKENKKFKYQRALLQGGRCEACLYIAEGYKTGGLALPLGNYHNHGPKGYAAEYVSAKDYENLLNFVLKIAETPLQKDMLGQKVAPLWKHYRGLKKKLF